MAEIVSVDVPTGKKDPVTIVVDKSAASGEGPLQIKAKNEEDNIFDVACQGEEDEKVTFVFTPPTAAVYQLHVTWGEDHVKHSPLMLNLNKPNNKAVTISHAPGGNLKAGENIKIIFDASEAGRGSLGSTCKTGDDQEIEVNVTKQGFTAMYDVEFHPPHEDLYILHVKWEGKNVKGSPFKLDMNPILSSKVIASNFKEPTEPGDTIEMDVCVKGAGNADLTYTCKGDVVGEIPIERKRISANDFHLTATTDAAQPDTYNFKILFNGRPISNSVHTYCTKPPTPEGLGADGVKHISTNDDESPVTLTFDSSEAGEGNFRVRVHGAESGPLDCTCEQLPDTNQHYQVSFNPPIADSYFVDTYWNDSPVPGSPFDVLILRPDKLRFGEPRFVELEIPVELPVDASEAGPGKLTASCKGEKSEEMEVFIEDDPVAAGKKKYIVSFRPSEYDCYNLSLFFDGEEVSKSPFVIRIDEPEPQQLPPAPKFFLTGVSARKMYSVGEKVSFTVQATNVAEGNLRVSIVRPSANEEEEPMPHIQTSEDGCDKLFNVEYAPNVCGEHKMEVQWDEEPIPGSPLVFSVVDNSNVPTFPITKPYKINFVDHVTPKAIESFGIHEESGDTNNLTIKKRRNAKLKLIYQAKKLGIHSLHVLVDKKEVPGSPFRVEFVKSDPSACKLLDIPDMAYLGEETSFTLDARKSGEGDLKVHARVPQGGRETAITHKNHHNGFYTILFVPEIVGTYHFDVSWADEPVCDSPVTIKAQERTPSLKEAKEAAAKVYIHKNDEDVFEKVHSIASPVYVCISTGNAGKGELSLKAVGPGEAKISMYDRENGVYTAEIRPVLSGKYTLGVFWNDIHIKNSPFKLDFTKNKSYLINQLDLDNVRFTMGIPHKFNVHCPPEETADLTMMATPTTAADISCTPLEDNPNSFLCEITPKEAGNHEITIKYNGKEVHNSPHNVQFEDNPDSAEQADEDHLIPLDVSIDIGTPIVRKDSSTKPLDEASPGEVCVFGTGLEDGLVGQEGHFTIETANAGPGKMEVEVYGPKGAFKVNVRRHPDNYRTLLARYDPKVVGEYKIHVLWDGKHVSQSPYSVTISEQGVGQGEEPQQSNTAEAEPTKELEVEIEPFGIEQDKPSQEFVKTDLGKETEDDKKETDETDF